LSNGIVRHISGDIQDLPDIKNCWKRIGVWGVERPRCPLLESVIHCRNCDVYIQAGRNLFERESPEDYQEECTEVMAADKEDELPGTISVVVFKIENEWMALPTQVFSEIMKPNLIHSFPYKRTPILLVIINVHGEIQLCMSLKELMGLGGGSSSEGESVRKYMMVVSGENGQWVFPVDEIHGILRIHPSTIQNVPATVARAQATYTKGIFNLGGRQVAFLDDELLFYSLKRSIQ
jgi:chemotaxis-related protein WspD